MKEKKKGLYSYHAFASQEALSSRPGITSLSLCVFVCLLDLVVGPKIKSLAILGCRAKAGPRHEHKS